MLDMVRHGARLVQQTFSLLILKEAKEAAQSHRRGLQYSIKSLRTMANLGFSICPDVK